MLKVNSHLQTFRSDFPAGAKVEEFAESVRTALFDLDGILGKKRVGSLNAPVEAPDNKRIVRYYQSQGWISTPTKKIGREVIYDENQLVQMFLSYCLRHRKTPKDEIKEVASLSLDACLQRFAIGLASATDPTPADIPESEEFARCDRLNIHLVASRGEAESMRVARSIWAMAGQNDEAYLKIEVCDQEIDLNSKIGPGKPFGDNRNIIDGDGSIRGLLPKFREEHGFANEALVQVITNRPHLFNWFADWGPTNPRDGVLHLGNYEVQFGVSSAAVCASYSLLLALCAELERRGISPYHLFHRFHPRGCLFDACEKKEEIVFKLLAGDICKDCLAKLRPHFSDELLREIALFQDAIRDRVRVLRQYLPDLTYDLQKLLLLVYVHALVEANGRGDVGNISLPGAGDDLQEWVFGAGVGATLGIARHLNAMKLLAGDRGGRTEVDEDKWRRSRDAVLKALRRLHPNLQIVRIDSVRLESGKFIASGVSLRDGSANSWEIVISGDLASVGITDTGTTYASIADGGAGLRFINLNTHLRVVGEDDTAQAVLHLPDGTLVDYSDGVPLRGCTAFS